MPSVPFLNMSQKRSRLIGVEAAGHGLDTDQHAATMTKGTVGVVDGMKTYAVFGEDGKVAPVYSISAGLDYPGVGPESLLFQRIGRATYDSITDEEALEGFKLLSRLEGIIPALESSHAIALAQKVAAKMSPDQSLIVCLSGRGDKDVMQVKERFEAEAEGK